MNREALAYVFDGLNKRYQAEAPHSPTDRSFGELLERADFRKLYAWAIEKVTPASVEQITVTDGTWVKCNQNSNHEPLVASLQGHGTSWCIAVDSTAKSYLQRGDLHTYYSLDQNGKPTIPRATIRMEGNHIAEERQGRLVPRYQNIFKKLADIKHLYTKFHEGRIRRSRIEISTTNDRPEQVDLILLTLHDLGFRDVVRIPQIFQRANELGLDLCPTGVSPDLILRDNAKQQFGTNFIVAMKQLPGLGDKPGVAYFQNPDHPWIISQDSRPNSGWYPSQPFIFRLRKQ